MTVVLLVCSEFEFRTCLSRLDRCDSDRNLKVYSETTPGLASYAHARWTKTLVIKRFLDLLFLGNVACAVKNDVKTSQSNILACLLLLNVFYVMRTRRRRLFPSFGFCGSTQWFKFARTHRNAVPGPRICQISVPGPLNKYN